MLPFGSAIPMAAPYPGPAAQLYGDPVQPAVGLANVPEALLLPVNVPDIVGPSPDSSSLLLNVPGGSTNRAFEIWNAAPGPDPVSLPEP